MLTRFFSRTDCQTNLIYYAAVEVLNICRVATFKGINYKHLSTQQYVNDLKLLYHFITIRNTNF